MECLLLLDLMERLTSSLGTTALFEAWTSAARAARERGIPVIYIRVAFREGYPEISANNQLFAGIAANAILGEDDPQTAISSALTVEPGDLIVTKRRVSAFSGSDLATILRGQGVTALVMAGLVTSGVVLSTLVEAVDLDYRVIVLSDGCADWNHTLHDALMTEYFPTRGDVLTSAEWAGSTPPLI